MADMDTIGPTDAPWETPDPLTCIRYLKSLVGQGFSVEHDSTGDLGALIQSALGGVRKEVDQHMEYLETEHVEHKTNPQYQRKMVRFWKCTDVTLHASKAYTTGDTEQNFDKTYYQWTKMQNLPGWWVKKIGYSHDGWLLVAKKDAFALLIHEETRPVDQRNLVEETISSEGSIESQRQNMGANMARQALQLYLNLPGGSIPQRDRCRSPRGADAAASHQDEDEATMTPAL